MALGTALPATLGRYAIDTPLRIAHFLAQVAHESAGFCTTEEYASGRAYEGRLDLGNTQPGDGVRFKGRGLIQLTGRANYAAAGIRLKLDLVGHPASVNDPVTFLLVSCDFWQQRAINRASDADDVITVTRLVNGGLNGLDSRRAYLATAKRLLAAAVAASAKPSGDGLAVLHRGCDSQAVAGLQRQLAGLGYAVTLDGDFGAGTEVAVKHFQAACGLSPDGIVGGETWQRIAAAAH